MNVWQAILLGAVQGFTEFLPVSSSGHLILVKRWLSLETDCGLFFDIALHIGTLIPVFILFFKSIKGLFRKPFNKLIYLIVASVPAAVIGVIFGDKIESLFVSEDLISAITLSCAFFFTACELLLAEKISEKNKNTLPLSLKSSIIMGVCQGFAVIPGLSRSGTVITGGTIAKLNAENNAEFAFLMSIPVILGAALFSGVKAITNGESINVLPLFAGVITSAVTGYIAISVCLKAVKKSKYKWFSVYLFILAAASVLTKVIFGV